MTTPERDHSADPASPEKIRERLRALPSPRRLLEDIFLRAPVGLQLYGSDGQCVLVNPKVVELFGSVPPPEYNIFEDTILAERGVADVIRRAFAGEHIVMPPIWYDTRELRNVDVAVGKRLAAGAELVPLRTSSGRVTHVLFVINDVTANELAREAAETAMQEAREARARAEAAAERSAFLAEAGRILSSSFKCIDNLNRLARLAAEVLTDFCIVELLEEDGRLRVVAAAHANAGIQPILDELGQNPADQAASSQAAARVLATGRAELMEEMEEISWPDKAGECHGRDLLARLGARSFLTVPLLDAGSLVGVMSWGSVGTHRYGPSDVPLAEAVAGRAAAAVVNARLFDREAKASVRAEAASRAKDEFLAMLGHELRNPLAPIVTALELVRRQSGLGAELQVVHRQVKHLRRLVDDLLDVSRITRGKLELRLELLDLMDTVRHGIELARPLIDERKHQLVVEAVPHLRVRADADRLAQVVANLLTNAARYTPAGGRIGVKVRAEGDRAVLTVEDTGIGIDAEMQARLFEPFAQARQSADRKQGGLGLGLAIVKALVEAHGGSVRAFSGGAGQGSTFEVSLRLVQDAPPVRPPGAPVRSGRGKGRVLVVDDNEDAALLLAQALSAHGYDVATALDPIDALRQAQELAPAAALLDIGLPVMDGYELATRLRRMGGLENIALVAITGYGDGSARARSQAAGFDRHLVKPVDVDVVTATLEALLERARSYQQGASTAVT